MKAERMTTAVALRDCRPATWVHDAMALAYWSALGKRDDDVFLFSYPKCGRTWLRFMITYYQIRLFDIDFDLTLKNLFLLSPNVALFSRVRPRAVPTDAPIHRLLGTHSEFPGLFRGLPSIVLRRDIRDMLVSYYRQRVALGEFRGDMESFLWSSWGLRQAIRYHNRWTRALAQVRQGSCLQLNYERLHSDPEDSVRACLDFMGIEIRDLLVSEAIAFASAENMRNIEAKWGRADFSVEQLQRDKTGFRVRRARVGTHKEELSPETAERMGAILRNELTDPLGYDY